MQFVYDTLYSEMDLLTQYLVDIFELWTPTQAMGGIILREVWSSYREESIFFPEFSNVGYQIKDPD